MAEFNVHRVNFFEYSPLAIHNLAHDDQSNKLALSRSDGSIEIWNVQDDWFQEMIIPPCEDESVEDLLWCQGHLYSAGLHGNVLQHDLLSLNTKKSISANSGAIWCLSKNATETNIAAGTEDGCVAIFSVSDDGADYERSLDRQEGRILSIAWYTGSHGDLIVTGGMDSIRIWSVKSGHAVQRLSLPRLAKNKETIVWALAVTNDFTIVSGDSLGKTCFWDGKSGTMIKSFTMHQADILAVAINKEGTAAYSAGIHPLVVRFERVNGELGRYTWVRSVAKSQHSHDVRALEVTKQYIISAGVDCHLVFNKLEKNSTQLSRKMAPLRQVGALVHVARHPHFVMLQYPNYLQLWKLGSTNAHSDKSGEILALSSNPMKLLDLKSRGGEHIVCSAISPNGNWIAYSDQTGLRIFNLEMEQSNFEKPRLLLHKTRGLSSDVLDAHILRFTPDGDMLISATSQGNIQLINMTAPQPSLEHTFTVDPDKAVGIHILVVSPNGKYFAYADHKGNIRIINIATKKYKLSLPQYHRQATAMCFHPTKKLITVVYTDHKFVEFNFGTDEYTDWSRRLSGQWNSQWLGRNNKIIHAMYNNKNPQQLILADEQLMALIDKTQPLPDVDLKLFKKSTFDENKPQEPVNHAFHICTRYKYLLHMDILADDSLLVVERSPLAIHELLPPALKLKKFGT